MAAPPLRLVDVARSFGGRPVLDGLSLSVAEGEVVALLGANGSGKSTTLKLVLGDLSTDRGEVVVAGIDGDVDPRGARAACACLPERAALYPHLSGSQNLRYFTALAGLRLSKAERTALLLEAGLPADAHDRRASRYSKGMMQKVALAAILARRTPLLLLDEPASGLDPVAAADLGRTIRAAASQGRGVLVVTHDLAGIADWADRAAILRGGRIAADLSPAALDAAALTALYRPA